MKAIHVLALLFLTIFSLSAEAIIRRDGGDVVRTAPDAVVVRPDAPVRDDVRPVMRDNADQTIEDDEWEDG